MSEALEAATSVSSWGMALKAPSFVLRPTSEDEIRSALQIGRQRSLKVAFRGHGNSYGDASLNRGGLLLDMTGMNRILSFDKSSGVLVAEPGVRLADVWRHTVEDLFWPPVVSGTMTTTLGGAAAMNIHGKNNYKLGTIGEHIEWFDLMVADGSIRRCSRNENPRLFFAAIGGIGMLGAFVRIALHLKPVYSGLVKVEPLSASNLSEGLDLLVQHESNSDYLVGWHDAFSTGRSLGRGLMHRAVHLAPGEDKDPKTTARVDRQALPDNFFGVIPKKWMWTGLWFFINDLGMRGLNFAKYMAGRFKNKHGTYLQSHAGYHFLLDYVPNYKFAFKPRGLIQYQVFAPAEHARRVFAKCIETTQQHRLWPYLLVTKKHRRDPFLLTHAVDGFSMAMDFQLPRRRERLFEMLRGMDELVLDAGGRFYFAKDSMMRPTVFRRSYPEAAISEFMALKNELDPEGLFESDLYRRVFTNSID